MQKLLCFSLVFMAFGLVWSACGGKDPVSTTHKVVCNGSNITYSNYVRALVKTTCIQSGGCHDGSTFGAKDYRELTAGTIADGLKANLTNGTFETAVLVKNRMPLGGSLPDSILVKLECWFKAGYPN